MSSCIVTKELCRDFGSVRAVEYVNLVVPEGAFFALLGANGAGKTTLMKVLLNIIEPSSGSAEVFGVDSRKIGPAEFNRIGYVSENQELPEWMTVSSFFDFCRSLYPAWDEALRKKLEARFALPRARQLTQLSRGQRMKAALISSLAYRPSLLILDEPFSGLDALVREEVIDGVLELAQENGVTVFLSSHDIDEVERIADWIGLIHNGSLNITEATESLQRRLRQVHITFPGPVPKHHERHSQDWVQVKTSERTLSFVHTNFVPTITEQTIRMMYPESHFEFQALSLKEIFKVFAKQIQAPE